MTDEPTPETREQQEARLNDMLVEKLTGPLRDNAREWRQRAENAERELSLAQSRLAEVEKYWADTEARAADAHSVYQAEAHRRGDVRHPDAYADLSEATKEWDRVLVRWVAEAIKRSSA